MLFHYFKAALACGLLWISFDAGAQTRERELARLDFVIDSTTTAYINKHHTHAITIGILDGPRSQAYSFGAIDPDDNRPADARTVFEIGPVSQTITATLLAAHAGLGLVDPESPILAYLPDSLQGNPHLQGITLKNLANHTSGLPRLPDNLVPVDSLDASDPFIPADPLPLYNTADLFDFLLHYTGSGTPGDQYLYSELGYGLITAILTRVSGMTFEELLQEYFAVPLGLENTGSIPYANQDYAMSHLLSGTTIIPATYDAFAGALGIKSSLTDLLLYVRAHFVLPESAIEQALAATRQFTYYIPPETDLGLAWQMHLKLEHLVYSYHGEARGSSTYIAFAPDERKAVIILTNSAEPTEDIGDRILDALLRVKPAR